MFRVAGAGLVPLLTSWYRMAWLKLARTKKSQKPVGWDASMVPGFGHWSPGPVGSPGQGGGGWAGHAVPLAGEKHGVTLMVGANWEVTRARVCTVDSSDTRSWSWSV